MKPEHSKMEYVRLTMEEYQALVEENKRLKDRLNFISQTKHNENIKNPLAFTSGMCCIHCDHKDEYIIDLEADNEELKQSVKHGKWLVSSDGYYPYCSECGKEPKSREMTKFCAECGAKMDKE